MSTGLVVCSVCNREVHQDGPPKYPDKPAGFREPTWTHCEDKTPMCDEAKGVYPYNKNIIVGPYCGRDDF